jgi:hypothetical protein
MLLYVYLLKFKKIHTDKIIICSRILTIDGTDNGKAWPVFTSIGESVLLHIDSVQPKVIKNPLEKEYKFWSELPLLSRLNKFISPINSNIKDEF